MELLGREMTEDLLRIQRQAMLDARRCGRRVTRPLLTKGISFGEISALPDGTVDTRAVVGVDPDLIVKPFQRKGAWSRCGNSPLAPRTNIWECRRWNASDGGF